MDRYKTDKLKEYIEQSEILIINKDLHIHLSKDLLKKYDAGIYSEGIKHIVSCINKIKKLQIKYPANAKPIFYVYIVPNENFRELLNYPSHIKTKGGGRPVTSYDLDGFNEAYGISSNLLENQTKPNIMQEVNTIHELAHLVHSMFFNKDRLISEGFAEALPLYTMEYENIWEEHQQMLKELPEDKILSAQQLIEITSNNNFNIGAVMPNKSCSFDCSYISSYLFVRGCLEAIASKFNINKVEATQKFLEIVKQSNSYNQWLIYDIANAIGIPQEKLLNSKEIQINTISNL